MATVTEKNTGVMIVLEMTLAEALELLETVNTGPGSNAVWATLRDALQAYE